MTYDFPQGRNVTQYQFVDDFSCTKGAHDLKFGANFRRYDITDYTFSVLNNPLRSCIVRSGPDFFNGRLCRRVQRYPYPRDRSRLRSGVSAFMRRMSGASTRA